MKNLYDYLIPAIIFIGSIAIILAFVSLGVSNKQGMKEAEQRMKQAKPKIEAFIEKYGAKERFFCQDGFLIEESIDLYGNIEREVVRNRDFTSRSIVRCSDETKINEKVGDQL